MKEMVKYLEELKSQVIQDCKGHNYCTGCSIWNPWEKKCYLCPYEYNNTDKICPRFIKWEMLNRIRDKVDEMFEKDKKLISD